LVTARPTSVQNLRISRLFFGFCLCKSIEIRAG
jgi:hypothetical protein